MLYVTQEDLVISSVIQITLWLKIVLMLIINLALHNACNPSISQHFLSIL